MRWIYPPLIAWEGEDEQEAVFQRPQQIFRALAAAGEEAIFFEYNRTDSRVQIRDGVKVVGLPYAIPPSPQPTFLWVTHPSHSRFQNIFRADSFVFDCMDEMTDEFSVWGNEDFVREVNGASLVTVVSQRLHRLLCEQFPKQEHILRLANAADTEHFHSAGQQPCPQELLSVPRPIIGFMGSLSTWIDHKLLQGIVRNLDVGTWVFIGPDHIGVRELLRPFSNVIFLGKKSYYDLPAYVGQFDVGIIPFEVRAMTHSSSPIKMYEYLAAGLSVVSTPIQEALDCPHVITAETVEEWEQALRQGWEEKQDPRMVRQRKVYAERESWGVRIHTLLVSMRCIWALHRGQQSPVVGLQDVLYGARHRHGATGGPQHLYIPAHFL
ncbi:glycosyltransferase [Pasteuria penetrans]|uniref:glycosyltransferase n=1 Tax=Pasteuria penetrans TaxID=86005 RepID=UPI000FC36D2A|nr:glycosyltransferase [Pasteuria penetrans]